MSYPPIFADNCPYCGTIKVSFTVSHAHTRYDMHTKYHDISAVCSMCNRSILAIFSGPRSAHDHAVTKKTMMYPPFPSLEAPLHTPEKTSNYFSQGMDNVKSNFDAAGAMFRKALEFGFKEKFPGIQGNLSERIEQAAKQGLLTKELAEWSHQIRLIGNEAVHGGVTKEDIEQLKDFSRLVFFYLFSLPGMLKEYQEKGAKQS